MENKIKLFIITLKSNSDMLDAVKLSAVTVISATVAYLQPLHNAMFVLLFMFFLDMVVAIYADIAVMRKHFNPKKFLTAFFYVAVYLLIITGVYIVGERMGELEESLFADKMITYVFVYFYTANIFINLRIIMPENQPIAFLEFMLGLEFLKRIPNLDEWMRREKENKEASKEA